MFGHHPEGSVIFKYMNHKAVDVDKSKEFRMNAYFLIHSTSEYSENKNDKMNSLTNYCCPIRQSLIPDSLSSLKAYLQK